MADNVRQAGGLAQLVLKLEPERFTLVRHKGDNEALHVLDRRNVLSN